jgi:membrane associated rhomboid family serine protease
MGRNASPSTARASAGNPAKKGYSWTIAWVAIVLVALWGIFSGVDHGPLFVVASGAIGLCLVGLAYGVFRGVVRLLHLLGPSHHGGAHRQA